MEDGAVDFPARAQYPLELAGYPRFVRWEHQAEAAGDDVEAVVGERHVGHVHVRMEGHVAPEFIADGRPGHIDGDPGQVRGDQLYAQWPGQIVVKMGGDAARAAGYLKNAGG